MQTGEPPTPLLVIGNLSLLIIVGLSISWWVLYFTDYFPVVLGLLGLGGFFAWIAFVINILSDDRKKQFQEYFDKFILQKGWTISMLIGLLLFGWIVVAPNFGTLIVDSLEPTKGHTVEIWSIQRGIEVRGMNIVTCPIISSQKKLDELTKASKKFGAFFYY